MKKALLLLFLVGCGGGGRLSDAECKEWAELFLPRSVFDDGTPEGTKVYDELVIEIAKECHKGKVDRQELECFRQAKNEDLAMMECASEGGKRNKRNPFVPR